MKSDGQNIKKSWNEAAFDKQGHCRSGYLPP